MGHESEYLLTAAFRPDTLSWENFLLNHSTAYQTMVLLCWAEYWLEYFYIDAAHHCPAALPACKHWGPVNTLGLAVCAVGLGSRSLGMATASSNFSHKIE